MLLRLTAVKSEIRHRNQLTAKAWEKAVQELGKGQTYLRSERVIQIPDKDVLKKRYFSIYFMIAAFISPGKFSKIVFPM